MTALPLRPAAPTWRDTPEPARRGPPTWWLWLVTRPAVISQWRRDRDRWHECLTPCVARHCRHNAAGSTGQRPTDDTTQVLEAT